MSGTLSWGDLHAIAAILSTRSPTFDHLLRRVEAAIAAMPRPTSEGVEG